MSDNLDTGQAGLQAHSSEADALHFMMRQYMAQVRTAMPVKIVAVHGGGVATVGTVDVQPMVHQQDGAGSTTPHGIVYGLPYSRAQGGASAFIIDPKVGDMGVVVVADRDITKVKNTGGPAAPDSQRRFSLSDGMYVGGAMNAAPKQYVHFIDDTTMEIVSTGTITLKAPQSVIESDTLTIKANIVVQGTMHNNGVNVGLDHVHLHVKAGNDNSGPPVS